MDDAQDMIAGLPLPKLPPGAWDETKYTSLHVAVLFADLENTVMISSTLPEHLYDDLIQLSQRTMMSLVESLKEQGAPIGEYTVLGDELRLFFYHPEEARVNYLLDGPSSPIGEERQRIIEACRVRNHALAFSALKAALQLKNIWLAQMLDIQGMLNHRNPLGIGMGIHYGNAYLRNRPNGKRLIEGYNIGFGKRIESFSRKGHFSHIMLSQETRDVIRSSVVKHTQLRQRIFFHKHRLPVELLKGVAQSEDVYELKFFHQLSIPASDEVHWQYKAICALDATNAWAYYQLFQYYFHKQRDYQAAFELAKTAYCVHPHDEKILFDLAKCYLQFGDIDQSRLYAHKALELNDQFDLAYEHLATIASMEDDLPSQIENWRHAVRLSPDSPINNFNLGISLLESKQDQQGVYHIREALRVFPEMITQWPPSKAALQTLDEKSKLPEDLRELIAVPAE